VPMGNSSPGRRGDKVYLTGFEGDRLLTIAVHRDTAAFSGGRRPLVPENRSSSVRRTAGLSHR